MYTDHRPLETLNKHHTKTLSHLHDELIGYNYQLKYKPGTEMGAADFLSRNPINISENLEAVYDINQSHEIMALLDLSTNERLNHIYSINEPSQSKATNILSNQSLLRQEQDADRTLVKSHLELHNGLWWYMKDNIIQLAIPLNLRHHLLFQTHDSKLSGHRHARKTTSRL